jgi:formate hydrogenlyase subunit 6/NADH:ubiquinone oxidoreductase subunit I
MPYADPEVRRLKHKEYSRRYYEKNREAIIAKTSRSKIEQRKKWTEFISTLKCIYCGFCEESCPVDSIVETDVYEYHFENRGENIMTKDKLLAIGDKYEARIAAARTADARYR